MLAKSACSVIGHVECPTPLPVHYRLLLSRASFNSNSTQRWAWRRSTTTSTQWKKPHCGVAKTINAFEKPRWSIPPHESFAREVAESPDFFGSAGAARSHLNRGLRPINVTHWYSRFHAKSEQGFCLSRCTWTPRTSPNATASSSSPHTCCLRERGSWRLQFANHRCAIAGVVVGAQPCVAGVMQKPHVQIRWVSMDPQRRPTQRIDRHRHGVQGSRHGNTTGLGRVCSEVGVSDVVFQNTSVLRVQLDTAGHRRQQDRGWVGRTMGDYTNICASCEVWTVIPNSVALRDILLLLTFNSKVKRRCMKHGYPPRGLRAKTAWNRHPRWSMSCSLSVSSNFLSSCCFGGLLSIPWCIAVTHCSAPKSEQALTSSASTCSTHSTWAFSRTGSCAPSNCLRTLIFSTQGAKRSHIF